MGFELFVLLFTAYVAARAPAKRVASACLLTLLAATTFLYTESVTDSPLGAPPGRISALFHCCERLCSYFA